MALFPILKLTKTTASTMHFKINTLTIIFFTAQSKNTWRD